MVESDQQLPSAAGTTTSPAPRSGWTAGRVIGVVFAAAGGLLGLALLAGGIAVLIGYAFERDGNGYFNTDRKALESPSYAITTEDIDLGMDEIDWAPDGILGDIRVQAESGDQPVFVGIAADTDVDRYLGQVAHDELTGFAGDRAEFQTHRGGAPRRPPGREGFWVAESEGAGEQAVTWDAEFGQWTAVVMNADRTPGIDVAASAGIKLDWAIWAGLGMFLVGLVMSAGAVTVLLTLGRRADRTANQVPGAGDL